MQLIIRLVDCPVQLAEVCVQCPFIIYIVTDDVSCAVIVICICLSCRTCYQIWLRWCKWLTKYSYCKVGILFVCPLYPLCPLYFVRFVCSTLSDILLNLITKGTKKMHSWMKLNFSQAETGSIHLTCSACDQVECGPTIPTMVFALLPTCAYPQLLLLFYMFHYCCFRSNININDVLGNYSLTP